MNPVSAVLPTITADLGIDVTRAGWLMNAYFVLLVSFVLIAGRLGDAIGHGTVFRAGCLVFAAGSLLTALVGDFNAFIVARGVQGLGSAMIFGTSLAIIATVYGGPRLAWAIGILTVSAGVSALAGTWISTTLVQYSSWHFSFLVPAVIGVGVAAFGSGLPSVRRMLLRDIDWLGGALLLGALGFLLLGLNHLHEGPETFEAGAPYHLGMHLAALGFLTAFVWHQTRSRKPLIKLSLLSNPRLSTGVIANGIAHSSMLATSLLIPFLLERGQGYSPTETQQLMLVMQVSLIAASLTGGWLYARSGSPALGVLSIAGIAGGLWLSRRLHGPTTRTLTVACLALGLSLTWSAVAPNAAVFLLGMPYFGLTVVAYTTVAQSLVQATAPSKLVGRVLMLFTMGTMATTPIGGLLAGWIIDVVSPRAALGVAAGSLFVAAGYVRLRHPTSIGTVVEHSVDEVGAAMGEVPSAPAADRSTV